MERLQKIISAAGITSRRAAEQLIVDGRVRVNGKVVTELGTRADPSRDHIKVDGKLINPKQPPAYILLNKPAGYVTTMSDPEGRPTVQDLLKGVKTRVYPVGRLDYNTEGLLILTNDGDFANLITHPRHEFPKTYLAKVKGVLDDRQIETLEQGVFLQDGKTAPAKVKKVRKEEMNSWVEISIHEGRKRQVRRMFDHVGHSVIKLKRIRTGTLSLGDLPEGRFRHLTGEEVKALRETALRTDEAGRQVKVYRPPVAKDRPRGAGVARATAAQARKTRPGRPEMLDTGTGIRRNQGKRGFQKAGSGTTHARTRGEGFSRRDFKGEGRTSSVSGKPARGRAGQKPGFGSQDSGSRSYKSAPGPRSNNKRYAGGKRPGTRPGGGRSTRTPGTKGRRDKR